jgi:DNA/RNA-binding domain of Phe-tRNA-synthetase-like protein
LTVGQFSYEVAADVFHAYPGYRLGVAVFDWLDNSRAAPALAELLRAAEQRLRDSVAGNVAEHPSVAPWRNAYRAFGAKPSEHRSSIESLLRRVVKPDQLPTINPLVDIGTLVSLGTLMPVGVHPLRHPQTQVELRRAREGDSFVATEGELREMVAPGEVVLADQTEVLTRRWTWRQSAHTRTLASSRRVFFNVDGLPSAGTVSVEDALHEVQQLVSRFCGGELVRSVVLSSTAPRFSAALS